MFADADHEVIDSPEALFRHLYEEHGVEEARDLDPETAPVQFWLRRHTELERAQRAARRDPQPHPAPEARPQPAFRSQAATRPEPEARSHRGAPPPEARQRPASRTQPARRAQPEPRSGPEFRSRPEPRSQPEPRSEPEPRSDPGPGRGPVRQDVGAPGRDGRRPAGFGDPLVEAVARALAGRGHDEAAVRSAIRSFAGANGTPAGEAGVRAVFIEPMLRSVAGHLLGAAGSDRPAATPQPPPTATSARAHPPDPGPAATSAEVGPPDPGPSASPGPPEAPAHPDQDPAVRPEAAWAVLWADLADPGKRAGARAGSGGDDGDDLMAVANAVQRRRRVRLLRR